MRRFLIVDDSATVRLVVKSAIRKVEPNAIIDEAEDAVAALSAFARDVPAVTFLDLVLANGTVGRTVLDAILNAKPDARVVVITGLPANSEPVVSALSRGAAGMIAKPVRADAVRDILATFQDEAPNTIRIR